MAVNSIQEQTSQEPRLAPYKLTAVVIITDALAIPYFLIGRWAMSSDSTEAFIAAWLFIFSLLIVAPWLLAATIMGITSAVKMPNLRDRIVAMLAALFAAGTLLFLIFGSA